MPPEQPSLILVHWQPADNRQRDRSPWLIINTHQSGYGLDSLEAALSHSTSDQNEISFFNHELTLIVPAELTLTARVLVPSAKPAHIRAAVPHLTDEWTVADSHSLHLSNGERDSDGYVAVTAIDRDLFTQTLAPFEESPLYGNAVYTDASLLPYTPNTLTLLIDRERVLFRWNAEQTGALEYIAAIPFLTALCRRQLFEAIEIFSTADTQPDNVDDLEHRLSTLTQPALPIQRKANATSLLHFCSNQLSTVSPPAINLRQGEFAYKQTQSKQWQYWKPLAIAAALCLTVQLSVNMIAGWRFNKHAQETHEQAVQLYRELFPDDKRIVNLRQQFQNHLNHGAQADQLPFFALFGKLTQEIQNTQVANPIQLHSLVFDTKVGNLQAELVVPNVPTLDDLQKRLSTHGMQAKVTSAQNADGVVIGRLSLAGKP